MHIRTVTGDIAPEQLGITLGHEHLLIDLRGLWEEPPGARAHLSDQEPTLANRGELMRNPYHSKPNLLLDDAALSIRELRHYREAGGRGLIELTTIGIGPDPQTLRNIAESADLHVIAGCGYYRQPLVPGNLHDRSTEEIADDMLRWLQI